MQVFVGITLPGIVQGAATAIKYARRHYSDELILAHMSSSDWKFALGSLENCLPKLWFKDAVCMCLTLLKNTNT